MKSAIISDAINKLSELRDLADEIDGLEAKRDDLTEHCEVLAEQARVKQEELDKAKAGLTVTQLRNLKEHDEAIFAKRKEYESLALQASAKQREVDELNAKATSAAQRHREIEASIESMKKKHFG